MIKTRFAPSPTGFLHIGGARTALFAWLFAQKHRGSFLLRIEDTDVARSTQAAVDGILQAMDWLNLSYDEGPIYQSHRIERYQQMATQLIEEGKAYHCHCNQERLTKLREVQLASKEKPRYDNHCRDLGLSFKPQSVVRFKNPMEGIVTFEDSIHGLISVSNHELDDLIILRGDGMPTYNFGVVIDDLDMRITHVIRGDDHINNTPRQINIMQALKGALPIFAHVPMILNEEGQKLSKRRDAVNVMHYQNEGITSEALTNYLVRLGWAHGDQEFFSKEELIQLFDLSGIHGSPASFSLDKLLWINRHYLKTLPAERLEADFKIQLKNVGGDLNIGPAPALVIQTFASRYGTLKELAESTLFLYQDISALNEELRQKHFLPSIEAGFKATYEKLSELSSWDAVSIDSVIKAMVVAHGLKFPQLAQPIRLALTGTTSAPSIDMVIYLLGQSKTLERMQRSLVYFDSEKDEQG